MALPSLYYYDISKIGKDFTGKKDLSLVINDQAVAESIMNILATEPGEKPMHPTFGCALNRFVFEPVDYVTSINMNRIIEDANLFNSIDNE